MSWSPVLATGLLVALFTFTATAALAARALRPGDISVPDGFVVEVAAEGLSAPTMVAFDDRGRMIVAESGYCPDPDECPNGPGSPKVTRINSDGEKTVLAEGEVFGDELPVTSVAFNEGRIYVAHGGTISVVEEGGRLTDVVTGLPGQGDHQANQMVFKDGFLYLSVGTVTNSSVVGPDNAIFGWLKKPELRQFHDVPCTDVTLSGASFESENPLSEEPNVINPLGEEPKTVKTSPFSAFGTVQPAGQVVEGNPNGLITFGSSLRGSSDSKEAPDKVTSVQGTSWNWRSSGFFSQPNIALSGPTTEE
ncbi:MAG TPA: hypothetical protein VHL54_10460, partial [Actinomycetota bacterium]|nr:hypothetical protein [Actinomycetota bacterium]